MYKAIEKSIWIFVFSQSALSFLATTLIQKSLVKKVQIDIDKFVI